MVVHRWAVVLFFALVVVGSVSAVDWGCCVPSFGECFNGDVYSTISEFTDACAAESGTITGSGVLNSCDTVVECAMGCCCPNDDVANAGAIRNDEDLLWMTQISCQTKDSQDPDGSYQFRSKQGSCVETCGGTIIPPDSDTHIVEGRVIDYDGVAVDGAQVEIPIPGGAISSLTDFEGYFSLTGVPEINGRIIATSEGCFPTQSPPIFFDHDFLKGTSDEIEITIQCGDLSCEREAPVIVNIGLIQGQKAVEITMEHNDVCSDFLQYSPWRCDESGQNCLPLPYSVSPAILDDSEELESSQTYCYVVRAHFAGNDVIASNQECITLGSVDCINKPEGTWCGVTEDDIAAIMSCDENNVLQEEPCQAGEICSEAGLEPVCIPSPICEMCNGLLGIYSVLADILPFEVPIGDSGLKTTCSEAVTRQLCYVDSKVNGRPVAVDGYSSCLGVSSCNDYVSIDSCVNPNPCGVNDECTWVLINEELGQGICRGQAQEAECDECEDIYGYCNRDLCKSISDSQCYYDEKEKGITAFGCIHVRDLACRYYDSEFECNRGKPDEPGQNAVYDIQYDDGRSGSHVRIESSTDIMSLGTCTWIPEVSRCIKDADMQNNNEDDCIENNQYFFNPLCVRDDTPPKTTFMLWDPPIYGRHEARSMPYKVVDDMTSVDDIITKVCYSKVGDGECYPNQDLESVDLPEVGVYNLYYYSEDLNGNLEPVTNIEIQFIDFGDSALESIEIVPDE